MTHFGRSAFLFIVFMLAFPPTANAYYDANYNHTYQYEYAPTLISALAGAEDAETTLNLPFSFPFYGQYFTQITVGVNGYIRLGAGGSLSWTNAAFNWQASRSSFGTAERIIAPLWDDWTNQFGGQIWAGPVGDHYIVEWWNVNPYGQPGYWYSFEVKLFPSGRFEFHYARVQAGYAPNDRGNSATIGYQWTKSTVAHPVSFNWPIAVADSSSMAFSRPASGSHVAFVAANDFMGQPRGGQVFNLPLNCTINVPPPAYPIVLVLDQATSATNWGGVGRLVHLAPMPIG